MPRDIPQSFIELLADKEIEPFFAVDLMFQTGPLYLWSGYGDFVRTDTGNTYLGAGQLLSISTVEETSEMQAVGASLAMSGIPSSFLSLALSEPYQGRECTIYFGIIVKNAKEFVGTPILTQNSNNIVTQFGDLLVLQKGSQGFMEIFSGEMDQMNISESENTASITVNAESALIKLERPVIRRFTNVDQQSRYPTDKGLEFIAALQDKEIFWGRKGSNQK